MSPPRLSDRDGNSLAEIEGDGVLEVELLGSTMLNLSIDTNQIRQLDQYLPKGVLTSDIERFSKIQVLFTSLLFYIVTAMVLMQNHGAMRTALGSPFSIVGALWL